MKVRIVAIIEFDTDEYPEAVSTFDDVVGALFTVISRNDLKSIRMEVEQ